MKIGLALGGGGARGLAHVTVLEAFDELGIKPSVIAGCSMGAVVGALYASGMSAKEIQEHALRHLSNRMQFTRHVLGTRQSRPANFLSLWGLSALQIDGRRLAQLALPPHVPHHIEQLKIPLKVVAANYETRTETVIEEGPLIDALAASIAIPGIIAGPRIKGHLHLDGGVLNPVPFEHAKADITVAIDVTGRPRALGDKHPSNMELIIGSLLMSFNELAELRRRHNPPEIYIMPKLDGFSPADFFHLRETWKAAEPAKDQLKRALELRIKAEPNAAA